MIPVLLRNFILKIKAFTTILYAFLQSKALKTFGRILYSQIVYTSCEYMEN